MCTQKQYSPWSEPRETKVWEQERPQDFGYGVNAPLPPEAKKVLKI